MTTPLLKAEGLPQLDFSTWPSQIFWLVVTLAALFFVLKTIVTPRIEETLEERDATITRDLDRATEFNARAEEAEGAYAEALAAARAEARRMTDEAKAEAAAQAQQALAEADVRISARVAESEARIGAIRDEAVNQAGQAAQSVAEALAARFSPTPLDPTALSGAVSQRVRARFEG